MRLNQDCVRDMLLEFEEVLTLDDHLFLNNIKEMKCVEKFGEDNVIYTIFKLTEAGYITSTHKYTSDVLYFLCVSSITWDGHQFLDNIRDNKVWKKTKDIASGFSSVSISMISDIASNVLSQLLKGSL